jgi:hypothetical protein
MDLKVSIKKNVIVRTDYDWVFHYNGKSRYFKICSYKGKQRLAFSYVNVSLDYHIRNGGLTFYAFHNDMKNEISFFYMEKDAVKEAERWKGNYSSHREEFYVRPLHLDGEELEKLLIEPEEYKDRQ